MLENDDYDIVLLDMNFDKDQTSGKEGFYWLEQIKQLNSDIVVILITAYGDVEIAVKAMRKGATDFVLKPWENDKLLATVRSGCMLRQSRKKINKLMVQKEHLMDRVAEDTPELIGESKEMKNLFNIETVNDASRCRVTHQ